MSIRLVAFDLDGTLIRGRNSLTVVADALHRAEWEQQMEIWYMRGETPEQMRERVAQHPALPGWEPGRGGPGDPPPVTVPGPAETPPVDPEGLPGPVSDPMATPDPASYDRAAFIAEFYDLVIPYAIRPDVRFYVGMARRAEGRCSNSAAEPGACSFPRRGPVSTSLDSILRSTCFSAAAVGCRPSRPRYGLASACIGATCAISISGAPSAWLPSRSVPSSTSSRWESSSRAWRRFAGISVRMVGSSSTSSIRPFTTSRSRSTVPRPMRSRRSPCRMGARSSVATACSSEIWPAR